MQSASPYLVAEIAQNFYCTEITKVATGGNTQRQQRTAPNTAWGGSLFANTSGVTCTQWMSTNENGAEWESNPATSTVNSLYHGDIILGIGIIIFFLSMIFMGLVFNTFYGRR